MPAWPLLAFILAAISAHASLPQPSATPHQTKCVELDCRLKIVVDTRPAPMGQRVRVYQDGKARSFNAATGRSQSPTPKYDGNPTAIQPQATLGHMTHHTVHAGPLIRIQPHVLILAASPAAERYLGRPLTHGAVWIGRKEMRALYQAVQAVGIENTWVVVY